MKNTLNILYEERTNEARELITKLRNMQDILLYIQKD